MNTELRTRDSLPVAPGNDGMLLVSPAQMVARVKAIQQVKEELMQEGVHYYTLGGNKTIKLANGTEQKVPQFSLGKPGAEMLQLAFGLSSEIQSTVLKDDPNARFTMTVGEWKDRPGGGQHKVFTEISMTGIYEVSSLCSVYANDGRLLARASGSCNNGEGAFRSTPYADAKNPVLKRAEKRALVAAMLIAAGASDLFTQDMEDMEPGVVGSHGAGGHGGATGSGDAKKGWMNEGQKKLVFAKLKPLGYSPEDITLIQAHIDSKRDWKEGKPLLDLIANDPAKAKETADSWLPKLKAQPETAGAPAEPAAGV